MIAIMQTLIFIVALRNEKGSYNHVGGRIYQLAIVALRNEKGSYNGIQA